MNKKFSTLMALALLAGGASAQYSESNWKWDKNLLRVHRQIIQLWMLLV